MFFCLVFVLGPGGMGLVVIRMLLHHHQSGLIFLTFLMVYFFLFNAQGKKDMLKEFAEHFQFGSSLFFPYAHLRMRVMLLATAVHQVLVKIF